MSRVVFHIDRLVLRGVRVDDLPSFTTALETELARVVATSPRFTTPHASVFAEPHAPRRGRAVIPRGASGARCGASVAHGIAEALGR